MERKGIVRTGPTNPRRLQLSSMASAQITGRFAHCEVPPTVLQAALRVCRAKLELGSAGLVRARRNREAALVRQAGTSRQT